MNKRYDVVTPRKKQDGGTWWHRVGIAFDGDKGITLFMDSLPLPDAEGRTVLKLFEPREKPQAARSGSGSRSDPQAPLDDDIPF